MKFLGKFRSLSFSTKIFFLLVFLAFVPPLAIMAQWYFFTQVELEDDAKRNLQSRWKIVESEVQSYLGKLESRVQEVGESPLFQDLHGFLDYGLREEVENVEKKIIEFLLRLSNREKVFHRICLSYGAQNKEIEIFRGILREPRFNNKNSSCSFPDTEDESGVLIESQKGDQEVREAFLKYSVSLSDSWGFRWGVLSFDVPFSELSKFLSRLPLPEEGVGLIVDRESKKVACAHGLNHRVRNNLCDAKDFFADILPLVWNETLEHSQIKTIRNHVILTRKLPARDLEWTFLLVLSNEAFGSIEKRIRRSSIVAGIVFFIVAVAASLPLSQRVLAPLRRLEEMTQKIGEGDFKQKLPLKSGDEIGRLSKAFNVMVESLANRDEKLKEQSAKLVARNEELTALNHVMSKASMSLKLDALLPTLLDEILSVMNLRVGAIRLIDGEGGILRLVAHRGFSERYASSPEQVRIGEGITGQVAETGKPLFIQDVQSDPAAHKLLNRSLPIWGPLRCYSAVPIVAQDKIIGVIAMGATGERTFQETDLSSLLSIGLGIGACIENARLFQDLESAYERLQSFQDQLVRAEKLSAMGQLVAGVAHEINNPLTTILGYTQLVKNKVSGPSEDEWLNIILSQAERCGKVVEKLLAFARETDKNEEEIDLAEVLKDTLDPARMSLRLHGIETDFNVRKGECFVRGDRFQLQQVFLNMITNAQHALTEGDGARSLKIDLSERDDMCLVKFIDNGPGISPELVQKIFDPFFTTKPIGKGTGLGLSLSYGIIKDHGGEILVESNPHGGATFTISLPRLSGKQGRENFSGHLGLSEELNGIQLLVVEDEEHIRDYLKNALTPLGVNLSLADSLKEARQLLENSSPDIILMDIRLPDGDGLSFYENLMAANHVEASRFAFMSGDTVSEKTRSRLDEIKRPHLRKPFGMDEVRRFLAECLAESKV